MRLARSLSRSLFSSPRSWSNKDGKPPLLSCGMFNRRMWSERRGSMEEPGVHEGINEGMWPAFETSVSIAGRQSSRNTWIESWKSFLPFSAVCWKKFVNELCPSFLGVETSPSKSTLVETKDRRGDKDVKEERARVRKRGGFHNGEQKNQQVVRRHSNRDKRSWSKLT